MCHGGGGVLPAYLSERKSDIFCFSEFFSLIMAKERINTSSMEYVGSSSGSNEHSQRGRTRGKNPTAAVGPGDEVGIGAPSGNRRLLSVDPLGVWAPAADAGYLLPSQLCSLSVSDCSNTEEAILPRRAACFHLGPHLELFFSSRCMEISALLIPAIYPPPFPARIGGNVAGTSKSWRLLRPQRPAFQLVMSTSAVLELIRHGCRSGTG